MSPILARTATGSFRASHPATSTVPESGRLSVAKILISVVLPAPLGPSTPSTDPLGTVRSTPLRARVLPNVLTIFSALT